MAKSLGKLSLFLLWLLSFSNMPSSRPGKVCLEQRKHHFTSSTHTFTLPWREREREREEREERKREREIIIIIILLLLSSLLLLLSGSV